jgi:kynurenine formamidase
LPTPHVTPDLLALIRTGQVYSLSVVYHEGMPVPGPMVPYTITPRFRHGDMHDIRPASAAAEVFTMSAHTGTHIDALCHVGEHRNAAGEADPEGEVRLYAGPGQTVRAAEHGTHRGQAHLSVADMPPIVARGVLIDVAGDQGVEVVSDSYPITAEDVQRALRNQHTEVRPGTAVLIRTGFHKHLRDGNPAYRDAIAGIDLGAAMWLHQQGMILAGADNLTVEAMPPLDHPVHRYLLVKHGVTHLENLYLDELAAARAYEFLLIVTPLRLVGATGSPVHPIAIT